jgi:hypothetical protein
MGPRLAVAASPRLTTRGWRGAVPQWTEGQYLTNAEGDAAVRRRAGPFLPRSDGIPRARGRITGGRAERREATR